MSRACGSGGFGTEYRYRKDGDLAGDILTIDYAANAASLGACAVRASTREELADACAAMRNHDRTSVVVVDTDINQRVGGYESWWDVPVAEVSEMETVQAARRDYEAARNKERYFL